MTREEQPVIQQWALVSFGGRRYVPDTGEGVPGAFASCYEGANGRRTEEVERGRGPGEACVPRLGTVSRGR